MPEKEHNRGKISSFFDGFSESASTSARQSRTLRKTLLDWAQQGSHPERLARLILVFAPSLALGVAESGFLSIRNSSKSIARITRDKL